MIFTEIYLFMGVTVCHYIAWIFIFLLSNTFKKQDKVEGEKITNMHG